MNPSKPNKHKNTRGLGRGLDALLDAKSVVIDNTTQQDHLRHIPLEFISRSPYQPRRHIDEQQIQSLAHSIKSVGLIQPIVVRAKFTQKNGDLEYELIAGERRWRACQLLQFDTIDAIVSEMDDETVAAMALIENIQRENLNVIEEAHALSNLQTQFSLTHDQVANIIGKSRSTVTNCLRLLNLSETVQNILENGDIEMGHARALLSLPATQQLEIAQQTVAQNLTVRQVENIVKHLLNTSEGQPHIIHTNTQQDVDITRLQDELSEKLSAKVDIQHRANGSGSVKITYANLDILDGIIEHIK